MTLKNRPMIHIGRFSHYMIREYKRVGEQFYKSMDGFILYTLL